MPWVVAPRCTEAIERVHKHQLPPRAPRESFAVFAIPIRAGYRTVPATVGSRAHAECRRMTEPLRRLCPIHRLRDVGVNPTLLAYRRDGHTSCVPVPGIS